MIVIQHALIYPVDVEVCVKSFRVKEKTLDKKSLSHLQNEVMHALQLYLNTKRLVQNA
jgi:hypothetical protein